MNLENLLLNHVSKFDWLGTPIMAEKRGIKKSKKLQLQEIWLTVWFYLLIIATAVCTIFAGYFLIYSSKRVQDFSQCVSYLVPLIGLIVKFWLFKARKLKFRIMVETVLKTNERNVSVYGTFEPCLIQYFLFQNIRCPQISC